MSLPFLNPGAAQGSLIRAVDFNDVQKTIARMLNDKIADYPSEIDRATFGYGQALTSNSVTSVVNLAEANQLAKLRLDLLKIAIHCGVESNALITTLPILLVGDLVEASHLIKYVDAVNYLIGNRFELGSGQYSDENLGPQDLTHSRTTPWGNNANYEGIYGSTVVRHDFTIDFGNAQNARYFFNSGGSLRISASRTGGSVSFQNTSWSNALSAMQTVIFNYTNCTASAGSTSNIGFYDLTNNAQEVFRMTADTSYSSVYAVNQYYITMSCNCSGANNNLGTASQIYVKVYFDDAHTNTLPDPTVPWFRDVVDGTLTSRVLIRRASGAAVNVTAPTGVNTRLLTNNS